jgi:hypothetical protein
MAAVTQLDANALELAKMSDPVAAELILSGLPSDLIGGTITGRAEAQKITFGQTRKSGVRGGPGLLLRRTQPCRFEHRSLCERKARRNRIRPNQLPPSFNKIFTTT